MNSRQSANPADNASGRVLWITGLSGSGKTTLARALVPYLRPPVILLDGDELRGVFGAAQTGFDRESRFALAMMYARLCRLLAEQGQTVVIATISLFHEVHAWNREHLPGYLEIFLDIPEEIRRQRDPKGLYAAFSRGDNAHMAGIDMTAEFPLSPHLRITADSTPQAAIQQIKKLLHSEK